MKTLKNIIKNFMIVSSIVITMFGVHLFFVSGSKKNISPEFQTHYDNFIKEANKRGLSHVSKMNVTIEFKNVNMKHELLSKNGNINLGHCSLIIGQDPHIQVNALQWSRSNNYQREMVIFHELAHCFLFKGHTEGFDNHGHKSLMGSLIFSTEEYKMNREKFLNELFSYKAYHVKDYVHTFFIDGWQKKTKDYIDSGITFIATALK